MKTFPILTLVVTSFLLGGCQGNLKWKRLDGGNADEARLMLAQKTCRIEVKLAGLGRAEEERDARIREVTQKEARAIIEDEYQAIRVQVYREIDACMNKQGYQR